MIKSILKLFYPPKCLLCRKLLDEMDHEYICRLCLNHYHQERPNLLQNEMRLQEADEAYLRVYKNEENLKEWEIETDRPVQILALFPYSDSFREAVLRWKYKGIRKYATGFARLLLEEQDIFRSLKPDLLIPVPLAPSRMRKRGFNQALDLAREIGKRAQIPVWDCLKRNKNTKPQAECTREERYRNIRGSIFFNENKKIELKQFNKGRKIRLNQQNEADSYEIHARKDTVNEDSVLLQKEKNNNYQNFSSAVNYVALVDDIYTTGSTAKECIKVLKKQELFKDAVIIVIVVGKGQF